MQRSKIRRLLIFVDAYTFRIYLYEMLKKILFK
jgi:hypothetical protein